MGKPLRPRRAQRLRTAEQPRDGFEDELTLRGLRYERLDLSGTAASSVEVDRCEFFAVDLSVLSLVKTVFSDCSLEQVNVANAQCVDSSLLRSRVTGARGTGLGWIGGTLRDVVFSDCKLSLAHFRFSSFKRVHFLRCDLSEADFTNADLRGVEFAQCDLSAVQFSHANLTGARIRDCQLEGIRGVSSLRGALIGADDLAALTLAMAAELGIVLDTED